MLLPRALSLATVTIVFLALRARAFAFNTDRDNPENNEITKYDDWYKWLTNNNSNNYKPAAYVSDFNDGRETDFDKGSEDDDSVQNFGAAAARNYAEITAWLHGLGENGPSMYLGKRSALRAALQAGPRGRSRRDPQLYASAPPPPPLQPLDILLGDSYPIDHGSLNNIEHYFGALHGSLHSLSAFPPGYRPSPSVFGPRPAFDASLPLHEDTGNGMLPPMASARTAPRRHSPAAFLHSLRPDQLRTFERRSDADSDRPVGYRGANFHDPALLWIGLGR